MSLSILTNVSAIDTNRNLQNSSNAVAKAMQNLSSGLRINTAADDASGYVVSQGLTQQVNGYNQASLNIGDAINMVQTTETSLNSIQDMLQRIYELGIQYSNGDLSTTDKGAIQAEVNQLTAEIDRQTNSTQFNNVYLLDGTANLNTGIITFQVGANDGNVLAATFSSIENDSIDQAGVANPTSVLGNIGFTWTAAANGAAGQVIDLSQTGILTSITDAISAVGTYAAGLGAVQNRLQYAASQAATLSENMAAANSSVKDVDMASEMTTMTQQQVLQQAGTAMLAQANSEPQLVLKLLQG